MKSLPADQLPDFLPRAADIFRQKVERLEKELATDVDRAREIVREILGDEILVRPGKECLEAEVRTGYLQAATGTLSVVAGAG